MPIVWQLASMRKDHKHSVMQYLKLKSLMLCKGTIMLVCCCKVICCWFYPYANDPMLLFLDNSGSPSIVEQ